jgi:hypothetical protein
MGSSTVTRSRLFSGEDKDGAQYSTHWYQTEDENGIPVDIIVESELGLPTAYPVEDMAGQRMSGMSGDYHAFVTAQMEGPKAAKLYACQHSETIPDHSETERRRQRMLARIAGVARRLDADKAARRAQNT